MKVWSLLLSALIAAGPVHAELRHDDAAPLAAAQAAVDRGQWKLARDRLLPLARKGNPVAQWSLARLLELPTPARDLAAALHWYRVLGEAGAPGAMEAVGLAYYLGRGTAQDYAQAADWFRRAGNAGEVGAQYILATMYEKGLGVAVDPRLARSWYERAASRGDPAARAKLRHLDAAEAERPGEI